MERFNKILNIDELNLQATVEPGVITEVFQNKVRRKDCFILRILPVKVLVSLRKSRQQFGRTEALSME